MAMKTTKVSIVRGSDHDSEVTDKIERVLRTFGITIETKTLSAHRNHEALDNYIKEAQSSVSLFIAVAGKAAALPGHIASLTQKPVIGVPVPSTIQLSPILAMVDLPKGVQVAVIQDPENAAQFAVKVLALSDPELQYRLNPANP